MRRNLKTAYLSLTPSPKSSSSLCPACTKTLVSFVILDVKLLHENFTTCAAAACKRRFAWRASSCCLLPWELRRVCCELQPLRSHRAASFREPWQCSPEAQTRLCFCACISVADGELRTIPSYQWVEMSLLSESEKRRLPFGNLKQLEKEGTSSNSLAKPQDKATEAGKQSALKVPGDPANLQRSCSERSVARTHASRWLWRRESSQMMGSVTHTNYTISDTDPAQFGDSVFDMS